MKKQFKLLFVFILFVLILFPFQKVSAATYKTYRVKLNNFTDATCKNNGTCNISSTSSHDFNGTYGFNLHEVKDGDNVYLGYCLHAGLSVDWEATVSKITDFGRLKTGKGNNLSAARQQLLKNILASGYQKTSAGGKSVLNGNILNSTSSGWSTCKNKSTCKKILATQILVWEVMEEARSNYDENPNSITNNTYSYVKTDSELLSYYKDILAKAKSLTDTEKPSSSDKTYVMHWNGSKFVSDSIYVGDYNVELTSKQKDSGITVSKKDSNNKVKIYSTKELGETKITMKLVRGTTTTSAATFRWYSFGKSGYQDVVMGDYKITKEATFKVKTEIGKIKIIKKDENKNNLLGSKFELYKCYKTGCSEQVKISSIDLTKQAESNEIILKKSGTYIVKETQTPPGHETIGNFTFKVTIDSAGKTKIDSVSNTNSITTTNNNTTLAILNVYNKSRSIKINKVDGDNGTAIKGATFQIYSSKGTLLKFNKYKLGNNYFYKYESTGKRTSIVDSNFSTYTISGLPAGNYYVIETKIPEPYVLSGSEAERKTEFKISSTGELSVYNYAKKVYERSSNATITIKNYKTSFKIEKIGTNDSKLENVIFNLYKEDKKTKIGLWPSSKYLGVYSYYKTETSKEEQTIDLITNKNGRIEIDHIPEGTYWIEEVKTADGYQIDPSVQWVQIKVVVKRGKTYTSFKRPDEEKWINIAFKQPYIWSNAKGEFCFYKIDEDGNYLTDGKFKIQSYDEKTSKYVDTALVYNSDNKNYSFDQTGKSDIYTFSPIENGQTCFVDVSTQGKYRIVEIEAPEGFELGSVGDTSAEFVVNSNGYVSGNTTIINKKITKGEGADAQAELIINISTGQTVVRYGIIIVLISIAIAGLIILNKKMSKK